LSEITVVFINYGADKSPTHAHHNVETCGLGGPQQVENPKISCTFFQAGFHYSNRRQYSGRSGCNFTSNYWEPWLLTHRRRGRRSVQLVIWATAVHCLPMRFPTVSRCSLI